jgi:hypothetical protein
MSGNTCFWAVLSSLDLFQHWPAIALLQEGFFFDWGIWVVCSTPLLPKLCSLLLSAAGTQCDSLSCVFDAECTQQQTDAPLKLRMLSQRGTHTCGTTKGCYINRKDPPLSQCFSYPLLIVTK